MQTKNNYLKSSKSKGDFQGCLHALSDAYQICCLCPLQKHWSNLKYKDTSDEMRGFRKQMWDTSMIGVKVDSQGETTASYS